MRSLLSAASTAVVLLAASTSTASTTPVSNKWYSTGDCTGATTSVTVRTLPAACKKDDKNGGSSMETLPSTNATFAKISVWTENGVPPTNGTCTGTPHPGYPVTMACGTCKYDDKDKAYRHTVCDVAGQWYYMATSCNSDCSTCTDSPLKAYVGQCTQKGYLMLQSLTTGPATNTTKYSSSDCSGAASEVKSSLCGVCHNYTAYAAQYNLSGNSAMDVCGEDASATTAAATTTAASSTTASSSTSTPTTVSSTSGAGTTQSCLALLVALVTVAGF